MKKSSLVLGILMLTAIAFSSCKKDYTCECTYKDAFGASQTSTVDYKDAKKSDAEDACKAYNIPGGTDFNCELK